MKRKSGKDILIEHLVATYSGYCTFSGSYGDKTRIFSFNNREYVILNKDYPFICEIINCIKEASFIESKDEDCLHDKRRT